MTEKILKTRWTCQMTQRDCILGGYSDKSSHTRSHIIPKCQDLSKSTLSGGDGPDQLNPKCQDLLKSTFEGWGGVGEGGGSPQQHS